MKRKVGLITGGGDCPGLNSIIRCFVRSLEDQFEVIGFFESWKGLSENKYQKLQYLDVEESIADGGTYLKSAKFYPFDEPNAVENIKKNIQEHNLECLVIVGGDSTLSVGARFYKEFGIPCIGIPKTIDNDISTVEYAVGFWTAVDTVMRTFDQLRTTAKSHNRAIVVEIMGRHTGWLAAYGGLCGGADMILVPEFPKTEDEFINCLRKRKDNGKAYALIAVGEGSCIKGKDGKTICAAQRDTKDPRAHVRYGGIGQVVADMIDQHLNWDTRVVTLGHLQRGGSPRAFDRYLGTMLGAKAAELVYQKEYGKAVVLQKGSFVDIPLEDVFGKQQKLSSEFYSVCETFFD